MLEHIVGEINRTWESEKMESLEVVRVALLAAVVTQGRSRSRASACIVERGTVWPTREQSRRYR